MRGTAWSVVDCVEATRPRAVVVENVPAFLCWTLFPVWWQALAALGYGLTVNVLTASYWGVPQRRRRVYVTGRRGAAPPPLHDPAGPEAAFGPCVDWEDGAWRSVGRAAAGARARIAAARARFGARCLVQHVTDHRGIDLGDPIRTVTTKDQWIVVDGDRYRPLTRREHARAMGFADSYAWPTDATRADVIKGFGNAVCPPLARACVARALGLDGALAPPRGRA